METQFVVLAITLAGVVIFLLGVPIILCMGLWAAGVLYFTEAFPLANVGQSAFFGLKYFTLLALPLFVLTGDLITEGGISRRLIAFTSAAMRRIPGNASISTLGACGLFAAISGSNSATTAAIGRIMIPEMQARGYPREYAAAVSAAGGTVGVIIPPSLIFILYGVIMNVSAGDLFVAGVLPGLLIVAGMVALATYLAAKYRWDTTANESDNVPVGVAAWRAKTGFLAIVVALGGIYTGMFSPTEAAGVAAAYCLIAGLVFTRELKWKRLFPVLFASASIAGLIAPIVAISMTLQETLTVIGITETITELVADVTTSRTGVLLLSMLVVFIAGTVLESVPIVIILAPIMAPIAATAGIDPIHFGVVFVMGSTIGFITPPYGLNLYMASAISGVGLLRIVAWIIPYVLTLIGVWLVVAFIPEISLILLRLMN